MAEKRQPGPITGFEFRPEYINDGTLCRQKSSLPGTSTWEDVVISKQTTVHCQITLDETADGLVVIPLEDLVKVLKAAAQANEPISDAYSLIKILKEMGFTGKATIKVYKGSEYVVLTGYAGLRKILTASRYKLLNPKIIKMVIGKAGHIKSTMHAAPITMILFTSADILDGVLSDKTLSEIGFTVTVNLSKTAIAAIVGCVAKIAIAGTGIACLPLAGGILVGIGVAIAIDALWPTATIVKAMENYLDELNYKGASFLQSIEREILRYMFGFFRYY